MTGWLNIESAPEGTHIMIFFPKGEKGAGGIECATIFKNEDGYSFWTHGGPNGGLDWDPRDNEMPTHWRPLPSFPTILKPHHNSPE